MPSLYGVMEKRNRAEHHLVAIEQCITDFFNSDPYPVITDSHSEDGIYHARLVHPKRLPARQLALMIGDCVHNMRSALDYIAWELAGADPGDMETMFPIYDTKPGFDKLGRRRIKRLPDKAKTLVEWLQPFDTGHGGSQLALAAINKIDAADKHKLLSLTLATTEEVTCDWGVAGRMPGRLKRGHTGTLRLYTEKPFKHNAVIATYFVSPPIPHMEVNFKFTHQVQFAEIQGFPRNTFVIHNLKVMLQSVDAAIKRFKPLFQPQGEPSHG